MEYSFREKTNDWEEEHILCLLYLHEDFDVDVHAEGQDKIFGILNQRGHSFNFFFWMS